MLTTSLYTIIGPEEDADAEDDGLHQLPRREGLLHLEGAPHLHPDCPGQDAKRAHLPQQRGERQRGSQKRLKPQEPGGCEEVTTNNPCELCTGSYTVHAAPFKKYVATYTSIAGGRQRRTAAPKYEAQQHAIAKSSVYNRQLLAGQSGSADPCTRTRHPSRGRRQQQGGENLIICN